MAEVAPAPATAPTKAPKKKSASKSKKSGPSVSDLILKAVSASKERKGVSLAALKKALAAGGYDVEKNNSRVKLVLKSLVQKGTLMQTKGVGASGSFKLNKKGESKEPAKKTVSKVKKPAAKKPVVAKKPKKATPKKPAVKKTPKKAKKPAAAKKTAKSPKKVKKPVKKVAKAPKKAKAAKPKATKAKAGRSRKAAPKKK
ncbi:histone H1-like [Brienomyrus brachyistius]|uniref:histone H1-like n=1 Tax=Brienomyrus brachyistius TaxID=42636 RepID=UPI0020B2F21C|nr:histone H1-like [Brienomyrus brachyistius]